MSLSEHSSDQPIANLVVRNEAGQVVAGVGRSKGHWRASCGPHRMSEYLPTLAQAVHTLAAHIHYHHDLIA